MRTNETLTRQTRDEHVFDIRNGCVTFAILLAIHAVQRKGDAEDASDLTAKNILLRIQKLLNPEDNPPRRLAGISTCYPTLKILEGESPRNKTERGQTLISKNTKTGAYELETAGEQLLRELVRELKRLTEQAERLMGEENDNSQR